MIEVDGEDLNPICIFPEGTTTNGTHLLKFKKGAFLSMRTIQPACVMVDGPHMVDHAWGATPFFWYLFLLVSSLCGFVCTVHILPSFTPTMKMLELHADKGKEDWEIYAECLRAAMAKYSGLKTSNPEIRNVVQYERFMTGTKKEL